MWETYAAATRTRARVFAYFQKPPPAIPTMRRLLPSAALLMLPALAGAQRFDFSIRNIMRGPDDTVAYHCSSPIFHAEGLEDPSLMLHGIVVQNVNFQDIVRLNERLIQLDKTD